MKCEGKCPASVDRVFLKALMKIKCLPPFIRDVKQKQLCKGHAVCQRDLWNWYLLTGNCTAIAADHIESESNTL